MDNLLVATHSKLWSVFKDKTLIWSACASTVPVAVRIAEFGHIDGMIVSLDADGALSINYMGTDPPSTSVVTPDTKEVNYEEMDEEHRQLLNVIRRSQGERRTEPKDRVLIRAQVPTILDAIQERGGQNDFQRRKGAADTPLIKGIQLTMRIYVTYTGATRVSNVSLSILTPDNIVASDSSIVIACIDGKASTPLIIPVVLRPNGSVMPTSLDVTISASYTLETGQPRVSQCRVKLPMAMMCRLVPPVKSSTFKFTLETNQEPLELTSLFEEMFHQPHCTPEWA
jgi:Bardet-Biedl syndrome 9 protein